MRRLVARRQRWSGSWTSTWTRVAAIVAIGAAQGCVTTTPLQTASTVAPKSWRAGVQLSGTPYCSVSIDPLGRCALGPSGLPLPELRGSVRTGVMPDLDVGLSLSTSMVAFTGVSVGGLIDAKRELWSYEDQRHGRRHLVAASVGAGGRLDLIGVFNNGPGNSVQTGGELTVPVAGWYGLQQGGWEWVASPRFVEKLAIARLYAGQPRTLLHSEWLGVTLAAISPGRARLAIGIDYLAPVGDLASGPFTVSLGGLFDLGGDPATR